MALKYCFEKEYVAKTLAASKKNDLAVIDTDGIPAATIQAAVKRGVYAYGYLNAGALEDGRSWYKEFKNLRLAAYDGWDGEYWVDVTDRAWRDHLLDAAKKIKAAGAIGLYFDNLDIYWMCKEGFKEQKSKLLRKAPQASAVYSALRDVIKKIVQETGLIVMPNLGEDFTLKFMEECPGYIRTVNQEGVCYEDKKAQTSSEKKYRTENLKKIKKLCPDCYFRIIEYPKTKAQATLATAYAKAHGWQGIYISYHKELRGD